MTPLPSENIASNHDDDQNPIVPKPWSVPLLRLKVNNLSCEGAVSFFSNVNASTVLKHAVVEVLKTLYTRETQPKNVRSVTLVLRSMGGVAYTTGSEIDDDHKEIHFSTDYIAGVASERAKDEITGVITHEMVHCWQYNGKGTCPGGLIEGIADWVRLRAGFSPPHWRRGGRKWDDGYQHTAYFLDWCEDTIGPGFVPRLNSAMKNKKYHPNIWTELSGGKTVKELWKEYRKSYDLGDDDGDDSDSESDNVDDDQDSCNIDGNEHDRDDDEQEEGHEKGNTSEDEDVDVVGRDEANEVPALEGKSSGIGESADNHTNVKETIYLRYQIQKVFLTKGKIPDEKQLITANRLFEFLESNELSQTALEQSKLRKVMRFISKLSYSPVTDPPYNFATRARTLAEAWATQSRKPTVVTVPAQPGIVTFDKLYPPGEVARQIEMPFNSADPDTTSEIAAAGLEEDVCGQSCVSTTHTSIARSDCSGSCTSRGSFSSHGSTKRGRRRSGSSSLSSSSWRFSGTATGRETQVAIIARKRLATLEFCGDVEGRRFVMQFEALIDRVDPETNDDDKRVLLIACFKGEKVNEWYELLDGDSMTYEQLKSAMVNEFKGAKKNT